jgi:hypothetical protein
MTDDPMRPIEEQLIRSARERRSRATDPFELQPVTRNLLHAEVARVYPPSANTSPTRHSWLTSIWTRLALGAGAVAAVVFLAVLQFVDEPSPDTFQLARLDEAPLTPELLSRDSATPSQRAVERLRAPHTAEPPPTPARAETASLTEETYGLAYSLDTDAPTPALASRRPAPPAAVPTRSVSGPLAATESDDDHAPSRFAGPEIDRARSAVPESRQIPASPPPSQSIQFAQVQRDRVNLQSPPMPDVLRSFQFLQYNDTVRIVDADGSIYEGAVQPAEPPDATRFVAAGTNRTTQYRVVFEGSLQQSPRPLRDASSTSLGVATATTAAFRQTSQVERFTTAPRAELLTTTRTEIVGQATLGERSRFEIRAVPTDRP